MDLPQRDLHEPRNKEQPPGVRRLGIALLFVGAAMLAWFWPGAKVDAVFGRLNYGQFWAAVLLSVVALLCFTAALLPARWRRPFVFRAAAVLLSSLAALGAVELAGSVIPLRHPMDNPWYLAVRSGAKASEELPFERPAHLEWEGLSRGDLALLNGDEDPYARVVRFETDMEGFRNSQDLRRAELVTIGDSFTEAGNVMEEETFTALLGERLGVTARNLGRAGYTAATELVVLKKFGLKCRPRLLVWQLAESNDLAEMVAYERWVSDGRPRYFEEGTAWSSMKNWRVRSPTMKLFVALSERTPRAWPLSGTFQDREGVEHPVRFLSIPALQPPARSHRGWPGLARAVVEGARLCRSNDVRLVVLMMPMKARVRGPFTTWNESATQVFGAARSNSFPMAVRELCAKHGIVFVDVTAALREEAKEGEIVFLPYDTHLSAAGHEVVAEALAAQVESSGWDLETRAF